MAYGAAILLVTNLVLVALVVAFRGRLDVAADPGRDSAPRTRAGNLRLLLAAGLVGSALSCTAPWCPSTWANGAPQACSS